MKAAYGMVSQVRDVPSQGVTRLVVELPIEAHVKATEAFYGKQVLVTTADLPRSYGVIDDESEGVVEEVVVKAASPAVTGPLCRLAGIWCRSPLFTRFLNDRFSGLPRHQNEDDEQWSARMIRDLCYVQSRRELDDPHNAAVFHSKIRLPYMHYTETLGWESDLRAAS